MRMTVDRQQNISFNAFQLKDSFIIAIIVITTTKVHLLMTFENCIIHAAKTSNCHPTMIINIYANMTYLWLFVVNSCFD